jgi:hypothetical protein
MKPVDAFCTWMLNNGANPDVTKVVCGRSMSWQADQPPEDLEFANDELQKMLNLQD